LTGACLVYLAVLSTSEELRNLRKIFKKYFFGRKIEYRIEKLES